MWSWLSFLLSLAPRESARRLTIAALFGTLSMALPLLDRGLMAQAAPPFRFTSGFLWFETGRFPQDLVAADFNGDGIADLATADWLDDGVTILLAEPDGTFRPRVSFGAGRGPVALVAFDADDDGAVDLVVANRDAESLSMLHGRGDGSFASARDLPIGESPTTLVAQDLTGDGIVDLAVTTVANDGTVSVLRGRGGGMFDSPKALLSGVRPVAITAADLLGNGRQALAVATAAGTVSVLAATPGDHFQRTAEVAVPGCPSALAASDVDRDGRTDLVIAVCANPPGDSTGAGKLLLLRGKGNGAFTPTAEVDADFIPSSLAIADLDLDGHRDLVGVDRVRGGVAVFRGDRAGGFLPPATYRTNLDVGALVTGDWNCDGRPDLVAIQPNGLAIVVLPGNGDGSFGSAPTVSTDFGPATIWLGDVNGDGARDLVAADLFTDRVSVLRGDGRGAFESQTAGNTIITMPSPVVVVGTNLRPGGPVDLVVAHSLHDGFLSVGRNQGDGRFTFANEDTIHTGGRPVALVVGDVNGDAVPDAVVANAGEGDIAVLLGDDAGSIRVSATFLSGGTEPVSLALGDVDEDRRLDLVVANESSHTIVIFQGLGTGEFRQVGEILTGPEPLAVALADLDQDGHLDLVTGQGSAYPSRGLVVAYLGDGHGRFTPFDFGLTARVGFEPVALVVEDLDGEGAPDVAVANVGSSTVTLLPGRRDGRFAFGPKLTLGTGAGARVLAAGDVDRDGRIDLAVAGEVARGAGLLLNRTGDAPSTFVYPTVDIEPGQCPNRLNASGGGFLRVALLGGVALPGQAPFDPSEVHPDSVRLEGVPALPLTPRVRDESGSAEACGVPCLCAGRAPDGAPDAVFVFDARALAAKLGPVRDGETRVLHFEARLAGGRVLEAEDCIVVAAHAEAAVEEPISAVVRPGLAGPNPLERGGATAFVYEVPEGGAEVRIGVYTVAGRRVATLARGFEVSGAHTVAWDGRDDTGRLAIPGVYFLRADVGGTRTAARLVIAP